MQIDYEPKIDYSVECRHCGCKYTFARLDIQLDEFHYADLKHKPCAIYKSYVVCPFCGVKHYIEFKKEKDSGDSKL